SSQMPDRLAFHLLCESAAREPDVLVASGRFCQVACGRGRIHLGNCSQDSGSSRLQRWGRKGRALYQGPSGIEHPPVREYVDRPLRVIDFNAVELLPENKMRTTVVSGPVGLDDREARQIVDVEPLRRGVSAYKGFGDVLRRITAGRCQSSPPVEEVG